MSTIYSTDLSDGEWAILAPLLERRQRRSRPRRHDLRLLLDAMLYVLRGGVPWRMLPDHFPPWRTVYDQFRRWRQSGIWHRINDVLRAWVRHGIGRRPEPSAAIIDSQAVRTSEAGGVRGYDGGKRLCGRKRHLVVDTQGLVLHVHVHAADLHDRRAAEFVLPEVGARHHTITRLFADMGDQGLAPWLSPHLGWDLTIVKRPRRWAWVPIDQPPPELPTGFQVLPRRWVIERTFAWLTRHRRLAKDWERLPETTETWIYLAMSRLMLRRLAKTTH